jgi:phosphoribosylamine--glycine ligase
MRVLLVGSGGREHALAWLLARSALVDTLYAAPGNPGIARHARCVPVAADRLDELGALVEREQIDFTVIGPEAPLVAGLADRLAERDRLVLGPSRAAAALEGSKAFAKALLARQGIPTARFATFDDPGAARRYCREVGAPLVVKADGLAAGKGAIVCHAVAEAEEAVAACMERRVFGAAGAVVVVEEFLRGEEVSFFALANGREAVSLGVAQDHKTVFDGDHGPNTGGMGAYSPVPWVDAALHARIMREIVEPTIGAMAAAGTPYHGILFCGLMLTASGPKVIEFNCRLGDPECQVLVARMQGDLVPLLLAAARGDRLAPEVRWSDEAAVCVTLASGGYPGAYRTGVPIEGVEAAEKLAGVHVFHAGTAERDGGLVTAGGRVLGVTGAGPTLRDAVGRAYEAVGRIRFEGMHHRKDIGQKGLA